MFSPGSRNALLRGAVVNVAALALCSVGYFLLPFDVFDLTNTWGFTTSFVLGLSAVAVLIVRQVRRFRTGGVALTGVLLALYLAVLFFAAVYFGLNEHWPGSVASLRTKVDALYFALSITSTVGFGDAHAVSQPARVLVAVHLVFNLAFVGAAVQAVRTAR
ncbi:ion channel [Saccharopolyspora sp. MS10]|uniref:ion channel n=1 Tax=Saccharopolyspora sp. MS10 TaxID=3385973 RepID=UPI0039A1E9A6